MPRPLMVSTIKRHPFHISHLFWNVKWNLPQLNFNFSTLITSKIGKDCCEMWNRNETCRTTSLMNSGHRSKLKVVLALYCLSHWTVEFYQKGFFLILYGYLTPMQTSGCHPWCQLFINETALNECFLCNANLLQSHCEILCLKFPTKSRAGIQVMHENPTIFGEYKLVLNP